ncbi:MAG TPA: hypothetical protein VFZ70_17265 [Euzebyales bacterium]
MTATPRGLRTSAVALLLAVAAVGCGEVPSDEHVIDEPVTVAEIEGADVAHLTLTSSAERRLDITTTTVEQVDGTTVVPNAAVIVDEHGGFWVYTNPEPQGFVRAPIEIDHEEGDLAYLADGPPVGTSVVTLGAAELFGAERGIGH